MVGFINVKTDYRARHDRAFFEPRNLSGRRSDTQKGAPAGAPFVASRSPQFSQPAGKISRKKSPLRAKAARFVAKNHLFLKAYRSCEPARQSMRQGIFCAENSLPSTLAGNW